MKYQVGEMRAGTPLSGTETVVQIIAISMSGTNTLLREPIFGSCHEQVNHNRIGNYLVGALAVIARQGHSRSGGIYQTDALSPVVKNWHCHAARHRSPIRIKRSLDAARTANAMREWMPFDIESGDEKINALIGKYKSRVNEFHSETKGKSQGVTLNCLRLYHSPELDKLSRQLIAGNPDRTWNQDNAK